LGEEFPIENLPANPIVNASLLSMAPYRTDYLTPAPSFLMGAATIFNLAGNFQRFNMSDTDVQADLTALCQDFGIVGQDVLNALEEAHDERADS
jgi:hypothetical protein